MKKIKEYKVMFIIVLVLVLVFLFGAFYWFQVRQVNERKYILDNSIKCKEEGNKFYEKFIKSLSSENGHAVPEFKFNIKLNTCLVKGGSIDFNTERTTMYYSFIKDIYSNKDLAWYNYDMSNGKVNVILGDKGKYDELNEKYFLK